MKRYILKRILISAVTLLVILLALFLLLELMPGSPFNDEKLSDAQRAVLNAKYGLDQPAILRFFQYVRHMAVGDFGVSYTISKNTEITALLSARLPVSARIGGQAVLLGTAVGLALGLAAAVWNHTAVDAFATVISLLGVSLPSYVFALALSYALGFRFPVFPLLYRESEPFRSSILPSVSLSMFTMATVARFTRSQMLEILRSDFMLFARSRGLPMRRIIFSHGLRNALIPVLTALAPLVVSLMTGSLVVEKIFSIPGLGSLLVTAIQSNDYNVVIALVFLYSAMYIGIMLAVDILYGIVDPRIRLTGEARDGAE